MQNYHLSCALFSVHSLCFIACQMHILLLSATAVVLVVLSGIIAVAVAAILVRYLGRSC